MRPWGRSARTPRDWAAIGIAIAWALFAALLLVALYKTAEDAKVYGHGPKPEGSDLRSCSVSFAARQSLPG